MSVYADAETRNQPSGIPGIVVGTAVQPARTGGMMALRKNGKAIVILARSCRAGRLRSASIVPPILLVGIGIYMLALMSSNILAHRDPIEKADIIVVLGGDGPTRASYAATLWHDDVAPRILVSGVGDCMSIRQRMIDEGVDEAAIDFECVSRNTWENAKFSAPILKAENVRRAVLVTSWFHSKRAIKCFTVAAGGIDWISVPVERQQPSYLGLALSQMGIQVVKEYVKLPLYLLWLSLPFSRATDSPTDSVVV